MMKNKLLSATTYFVVFSQTLLADPIISEFLADNDSITVPGASAQLLVDWIEIHNPDDASIDLGGWHLTDDPNDPGMWHFPPGTILASGAYLVVFADDASTLDAQGFLHTNFKLSAGGDFVALTRPDESIASSFPPDGTNYPVQSEDISYGVSPSNNALLFFPTPTPGAQNSTSGISFAAAPTFSVSHGIYSAPFSLAITSETAGATIYVTTDSEPPLNTDSSPTATASIYNGPLTVSETQVIRAATTAANSEASTVTTQTFIFPDSVASQNTPSGYPTAWGAEPNADYEVDPTISQSSTYATRFRQGLKEIPTISVSGKLDDIFGPSGIYSRTTERGVEVPVSAEYFEPSDVDGTNDNNGFQIDCGFRIQGGGSRQPDRAIKHSLSLRFRAALGPGRLDFPIFDGISNGEAEKSYNSLQLRAIFQNSWFHGNSGQRERATYIQDQWMRDSFIAMGNNDGCYGTFANVYINGLYWGVYNLHERADDDHFADYNGYDKDEITGYSPKNKNGPEGVEYQALRSTVLNGTWEEINAVLDIDQYIDYVITHQFGDNDDLRPDSNLRLAGGGSANAKWKIYLWDLERTLENDTDTDLKFTDDGVDFLSSLEDFPEFRRLFADRAHKHLFNGGALANDNNRARFVKYVDILDVAIIGESARWGDDRRTTPYNRDSNWKTAVYGTQSVSPTKGVLGGFFPTSGLNRTDRIISAWKARAWDNTPTQTWLPSHDPAGFSLADGSVISPGNTLSLTGASGTTLYTLDGSDPADGGGIQYNGGTIPITESGVVRTRSLNNGQFSVLNEASFIIEAAVDATNLVISEIHYNPQGDNDTAFIELQNTSAQTINLLGASFADGIEYTFSAPQTLAAGAHLVLAEDSAAFATRYGFAPADTYTGSLSRSGEIITLNTSMGQLITTVEYDDALPWPVRADDLGSSLEISESAIYNASQQAGGTPGSAPSTPPGIVINEVLANSDSPLVDTIELHNPTDSPIDVSGWFLSDDPDRYQSFRIPNDSIIPSLGFLLLDESDFNTSENNSIVSYSGTLATIPTTVTISGTPPATGTFVTISGYLGIGTYNGTHEITITGANSFTIAVPFNDNAANSGTWTPGAPFALSSSMGETLTLSTPAEEFSDSVTFGGSLSGESFARYPNVTSGVLVPASSRTFGSANTSPPVITQVRITEIFYVTAGMFVEIHNTSNSTQSLENWTLRGNADFDFSPSDSLAPGETAIIAANPASVNNVPAGTRVFGPWEADDTLLGVNGGVVRLRRPDTSSPAQGDPPSFPQVIEDEVVFLTDSPWPSPGPFLQRDLPNAPGSSPASWSISPPTPGVVNFTGTTFADFVTENNLSGTPSADADHDGIPDLGEFALGLDPNSPDPSPLGEITPGITPTFTSDPNATGVNILLQASDDLITWDIDPSQSSTKLFFRLNFTQ